MTKTVANITSPVKCGVNGTHSWLNDQPTAKRVTITEEMKVTVSDGACTEMRRVNMSRAVTASTAKSA